MEWNLRNYLLILLVMINFFCKKPFEEKIQKGDIYNPNFTYYSNQDIEEIFNLLKIMFRSVEKKDLSLITNYIDQEKGIYTDLKAWKSKQDFLVEIKDPESYLNSVYLNSENLKKITNDSTQISLYDLIKKSQKIKADFYFTTDSDCEVKLIIMEKPEESYRFNNPYFIKINNRWFIYRLF